MLISFNPRLEGKPATRIRSPSLTIPSVIPYRWMIVGAVPSTAHAAASPFSPDTLRLRRMWGLRQRMRVTSPSSSSVLS